MLVKLSHAPAALYSPETFFLSVCGTIPGRDLSKPQGILRPKGLGKFIKLEIATCDLEACNVVPQQLRYHVRTNYVELSTTR
jgi:hypothetical protein